MATTQLAQIINQTAANAISTITSNGDKYRILSEDGKLRVYLPQSLDYDQNRLNLVIVNGRVQEAPVF